MDTSKSEFVRFCTMEQLKEKNRFRDGIKGRDVTVFLKDDKLYALDSVCYHAGGSLDQGDIEDYFGNLVIICPWHRFKIGLENGEGYFQNMQGTVCSKGKKQRSHRVKEENGEIFVALDQNEEELPSDQYAFMGMYKGW
eukprot:TRINITY_DN3108_c0_g1_i1.p1 TRINITY_DN3108_c0_g1~~TRINITY_DN3108_c0_g1_i1.p1  ORF type:complete len:153 (-),score=20.72 TRINITY_DN3108_c0_g1_i1:62-478(-)